MKQQNYGSFRIGDENDRLPYSLLCTKVCLHVKLLHVSLKIQGTLTRQLMGGVRVKKELWIQLKGIGWQGSKF